MSTVDVLRRSVEHTHENLAARLEGARTTAPAPGQPRKPYEDIDTFLAIASKHLGAVDAVLLPAVRRNVKEGGHLVHDYVHAEKELEIALAHVKARAYGSTYEAKHAWPEVWSDVGTSLAGHRGAELALAGALTDALAPAELDDVTERLQNAEAGAPTRPHPYAPHTGLAGSVSRRVMHAVDAFWDTAEGRMAPEPEPPRHKKPGLLAQYLLADPRFDEDEPPE
ncbi:hypothetical protein EKO23_04640 [Nocardioides guangzhouensis]|uniref:Hemerythrin domain-containing protein n=1 Tax=Nocardioides guangzhouensis TaxID=2497878 RepID=A0A4Q4ZJM1_9ACTN|nr:hypothetical protein [Nocardioides guangzhouensis]RYP87691.1 hypothetical protein EKO23_04640 [Nocardioides guangzhouensis]